MSNLPAADLCRLSAAYTRSPKNTYAEETLPWRPPQETLAEMIGTTRSRVSHFMNKFRKLGLISYNGMIEVHNSMLNAVLHDKPEIQRD
jgi:CRP-like cAMP-binding protein